MGHHFIAKLTVGGGPHPLVELSRIIEQAADSVDQTAWFATKMKGAAWSLAPAGSPSIALIFFKNPDGHVDAIVARILKRQDEVPENCDVQELYGQHEGFKACWLLADPFAIRLASLQQVPGKSSKSRTAADSFVGNLSFAYWSFDSFDQLVTQLRSVDIPQIGAAGAPESFAPRVNPAAEARSDSEPVTHAPGEIRNSIGLYPRSNIYGVDFSGGQESATRGNSKIWIASWDVDRNAISLTRGTDNPPLRRCDLPRFVSERPGWWVFDFPFGVARETANALGLGGNDWDGWLDWCVGGADATERRDVARASVRRSSANWSARREIDAEHKTTWFPLFEQLYRQTIYGARDVLSKLVHSPDVAILPWGERRDARILIAEGFPGITIRGRLGLKGFGYKGAKAHHREERERILAAIATALPVPVPADVAGLAVEDVEGDALDALVLLMAGWVSQDFDGWAERRDRLAREERLVEGWFPA